MKLEKGETKGKKRRESFFIFFIFFGFSSREKGRVNRMTRKQIGIKELIVYFFVQFVYRSILHDGV